MLQPAYTDSRKLYRTRVDLPCSVTVLGETGRVFGTGSAILFDGNREGVGLADVRLRTGDLPFEDHQIVIMPTRAPRGTWAKIRPVRRRMEIDSAFIGGRVLHATSTFTGLF